MPDKYIRIGEDDESSEIARMLAFIAKEDMRSEGSETAWLIKQEYARRYSQPNPLVTVEDAEKFSG